MARKTALRKLGTAASKVTSTEERKRSRHAKDETAIVDVDSVDQPPSPRPQPGRDLYRTSTESGMVENDKGTSGGGGYGQRIRQKGGQLSGDMEMTKRLFDNV